MIPAYQYTFALTSLTIADYFLASTTDTLVALGEKKQVQRAARWTKECLSALPKQKLSRGADRDADLIFRTVSPHIDMLLRMADNQQRAKSMIALFWAIAPMLVDVTTFCDTIVEPNRRKWDYLLQTLTTLCEHLQSYYPDADEQGHKIYCQWSSAIRYTEV